ncbi:tripartite motif-containing protein 72-like [Strongylocentrotus purpuratus]|uniref:RING-type domain-containing protein n=1 Tax=Strongylocentrotus purpuratus TaxID=7668 RepID=A0A7M7NZM9_STRPU|nr:tripartite motif-containing protein 72-like [Strongylocentrotus purpuratus]
MAEKQDEEDVPIPSQGLTCPLCLGIFDDATLLISCGHTFCRPCLRKYDLSHQDLDHMVCPLCRTVTKLSANRVDDLLPNVTVNGLVDDHRARSGETNVILEMWQECTACNLQVSDLLHRCNAKKSELEKNIQTLETHHREAHTAFQLLREDVGQACRTKVKQLEDNRRVLVEKIDSLERSFDEALNGLITKERQMIKSICSSVDLVGYARLGCLETDSLVAHTFLCEEIDGLLKEGNDQTSAATIREKAKKQRFNPAEDTSLDLGNISETDAEAALDDMLKGVIDDTSAATIGEEVQKKRSQFAEEDIPTGISVPETPSKVHTFNVKSVEHNHADNDFLHLTYTVSTIVVG